MMSEAPPERPEMRPEMHVEMHVESNSGHGAPIEEGSSKMVQPTQQQPQQQQQQQPHGSMMVDPQEQGEGLDNWPVDDRLKRMIVDLQRQWVTDYQHSREKVLVEVTEKLHQEFLADQQKIRTELLSQFKEELDQTRTELETKYRESLKMEMNKMAEKYKRDLAAAKKKQWCWQCENEAIYHCCWNTAYCSVECQQGHWQTHRKFCRRKKGNATAPG
ncbi:unnamed protein product [Caenorhabditis auriculariae]|uniref:MYND-type domain-containing protein n=1 Tax=Caenorhabditis auriculariae TaxID=2777116 RepID=A0A8S1HNW2_9PELO|nr:unnamed protein product [Caenorhabditis auriculariae]